MTRLDLAGSSHERHDDPLRSLLRAADPVAADAEGEERALGQLALALSGIERRGPRPALRLAFALPALALGSLLAMAWLGVRFAERPRPAELGATSRELSGSASVSGASPVAAPVSLGASSAGGESAPDPFERRQLQFETAGGTRVIWVLDPRFAL